MNSAFESMMKCFPWPEGCALHTQCIIRYSNNNFLNPEPGSKNNGGKIAVVVISIAGLLIVSVVWFYSWKRRCKSKREKGSGGTKLLKILSSSGLSFKYSTIEKATRSFNDTNKLGERRFGTVYKGVLPDGKEVAVKTFSSTTKIEHWTSAMKSMSLVVSSTKIWLKL